MLSSRSELPLLIVMRIAKKKSEGLAPPRLTFRGFAMGGFPSTNAHSKIQSLLKPNTSLGHESPPIANLLLAVVVLLSLVIIRLRVPIAMVYTSPCSCLSYVCL